MATVCAKLYWNIAKKVCDEITTNCYSKPPKKQNGLLQEHFKYREQLMSNIIYLWLDWAIADVIPSPASDVYLIVPTQILNTAEKSKFLFGGTLRSRLNFTFVDVIVSPSTVSGWLMGLDFGDSCRIYQACELVYLSVISFFSINLQTKLFFNVCFCLQCVWATVSPSSEKCPRSPPGHILPPQGLPLNGDPPQR